MSCVRDFFFVLSRQDERRIEVTANGLPLWRGVAAWRRAALRRYNPGAAPDGCWHATPRQRHHCWGSCAGRRARQGPDLNPELAQANRCRLVVLGIEVGGRWSSQAAEFVRRLTRSRARAAPVAARAAVTFALALRWSALLAFAAARSFAGQPSFFATCCHCQRRWRDFPPEQFPRGLCRTTPHFKSPGLAAAVVALVLGHLHWDRVVDCLARCVIKIIPLRLFLLTM